MTASSGCKCQRRQPQGKVGFGDRFLAIATTTARTFLSLTATWNTTIGARISEFGFSPNRVAALGENVILLINLAWSVVLYLRFLRGRGSFTSLEKWQTDYLPIYGAWVGTTKIDTARGVGIMVNHEYVPGEKVLPSDDEVKKMRSGN